MTTSRRVYTAALLTIAAAANLTPQYLVNLLITFAWVRFSWRPDPDIWIALWLYFVVAASPALVAVGVLVRCTPPRLLLSLSLVFSWLSAGTAYAFFRIFYLPLEDPNTGYGSPAVALLNILWALMVHSGFFLVTTAGLRYCILKGVPKKQVALTKDETCPQPEASTPKSEHSNSSRTTAPSAPPSQPSDSPPRRRSDQSSPT